MRLVHLTLASISLACLPATAPAQKVGDRIVVSALSGTIKSRSGLKAAVPKGTILKVHGAQDGWFWVVWSSGKGSSKKGWIISREVIPLEKAIAFFSDDLRIDPTAEGYNTRGAIFLEQGDVDSAMKDFDAAVELDPRHAMAHNNRAACLSMKGEYAKAIADYTEAIQLDPADAYGYNNLAWLRSTCAQDEFRDAAAALELANRACELTEWSSAAYLDTLAAAYAESGDFAQAVDWQKKAVELAPPTGRADFKARLGLYERQTPFREMPTK